MTTKAKPKPITGLLTGKKEIADYLNISDDTLKSFIQMGMPASIINNRYYAHRENLELWFQLITKQQSHQVDAIAE